MGVTQPLNVPTPPSPSAQGQVVEGSMGIRQANTEATQYQVATSGNTKGYGSVPTKTALTPVPMTFNPKPVPQPKTTPDIPPVATTPPANTTPQVPPPQATSNGNVPPAKDPQPPKPNIDALTGRKKVETHPNRYSSAGKAWTVSALSEGVGEKPNITPVTLPFGTRPALKPLLKTDGIVVKVGGEHLVSPQTMADILKSDNPHYDTSENGRIGNTPMGKTVPVIEVNVSNLPATGSRRDISNSFAGVRDVDYIYETPTIDGIPEGILDQINYTIDPATERPMDHFTVWKLGLTADYTIEKLITSTAQEDGKLDTAKLQTFLSGLGDRLKLLRKDFNIIKTVFYKGELPEADRNGFADFTQRATSDTTDDDIKRPETSNYVIKTTVTTDVKATPTSGTPSATGTTPTGAGTTATTSAPTTGGQPASTATGTTGAAGQSDAYIARWTVYGFTAAEKAQLKATPLTGEAVTLTDGTTIQIGGVNWGPTVTDKARVILPPGAIVSSIKSGTNVLGDKLAEYFGAGLSGAAYFGANKRRIAELVQLVQHIKELETANSKTY